MSYADKLIGFYQDKKQH